MDTVEIADRNHAAARARRQPGVMAENIHRLLDYRPALRGGEENIAALAIRAPAPSAGSRQGGGAIDYWRLGTRTSASPSITTVSPTLHTVLSATRFFSAMTSVMVTRASTVSPARTGALKRRFWLR